MEKEHKKKRRKQEDENDGRPKSKKSKHEHSIADTAIKQSGEGPQTLEIVVLKASVQENGHSRKKTSKNKQTRAKSFHDAATEGSVITSSKLLPPISPDQGESHEKRKQKRNEEGQLQFEIGDATTSTIPNESLRQDRDIPQKKQDKHNNHQAKAETPLQQLDVDVGNAIACAHESGSFQRSNKSGKKHDATAENINLEKHHSQHKGITKDSARYDSMIDSKEKPNKRKKDRKHAPTAYRAGEDELQSQEGRSAAQARLSPPTSRYHETPHEQKRPKDVDADDTQHSVSNDTITSEPSTLLPPYKASQKEKKRKHVAREALQHESNNIDASTKPPRSISQGQDLSPHKKPKLRHAFNKSEAEYFSHQSPSNAPNPQDLQSSARMPALDPSFASASPFFVQTSSIFLPLAPISQLYPLAGLCAEHLSPLILTYYIPFRSVVLAYENVRIGNNPSEPADQENYENNNESVLATHIDEYAGSFVWVTADFLLFRPKVDTLITGWVNLQHEGHIGLVCWNIFSASVRRNRIPKRWRWVKEGWDVRAKGGTREGHNKIQDENDDEEGSAESAKVENLGHFEDEIGTKIEGALTFRIKRVEVQRTWNREEDERCFISLEGSLLTVEEEEKAKEETT